MGGDNGSSIGGIFSAIAFVLAIPLIKGLFKRVDKSLDKVDGYELFKDWTNSNRPGSM